MNTRRSILLVSTSRTLSPDGGGEETKARQLLAKRLSSADLSVTSFDSRAPGNEIHASLQAAKESFDFVLWIAHAAEVPNGFVTMQLLHTSSGQTVSGTAFERTPSDRLIDSVVRWVTPLTATLLDYRPFDRLEFVRVHSDRGECAEVLEVIDAAKSAGNSESGAITEIRTRCTSELNRASGAAQQYLLRVRMADVPSGLQSDILEAPSVDKLAAMIQHLSNRTTDLIVSCAESCASGKIRLVLPLERDLFRRANSGSRRDPLSALRPFGEELVRFRSHVSAKWGKRAPFSQFPIHIAIQNQVDEGDIEVSATGGGAKLRGSERALKYLSSLLGSGTE